MVTDEQYWRLMKALSRGKTLSASAAKAGMDEKTGRKYRDIGGLPSHLKKPHGWRTRKDRLERYWPEIEQILKNSFAVESKTIFEYLCRKDDGYLKSADLRTLQRRVRIWRATEGHPKEVMFPQIHKPGEQGQSDFTHMNSLGVTIAGDPFRHLFFHFTLTYSNWEAGMICFGESFESLSTGLQHALWELGGAPAKHKTDCLTAAVNNLKNREEFTERYHGLVKHYGMEPLHNNPGRGHENGDIEQSHYRFKKAAEQELLLRGSADFANREEYEAFLQEILRRRNVLRKEKLAEELVVMTALPSARLDAFSQTRTKVSRNSTICIHHNIYSVDSRLIGEWVQVRLLSDCLEVWYSGSCYASMPRLSGEGRHKINYRHVIDSLIRKPGAFAAYRFREDLFPSLAFRVAYDELCKHHPATADRQYLGILYLAAKESEQKVHQILDALIRKGQPITADEVQKLLFAAQPSSTLDPQVAPVDLADYDQLLVCTEVSQ